MRNRNICLLASIFLIIPIGYLFAAAESDGGLADEIFFEGAGDRFGQLFFPEEIASMQQTIAASLNNEEEEKNESADLVAAGVTDISITMRDVQKKSLKRKRASYATSSAIERGKSIVTMILEHTNLNDNVAKLIENYAKDLMVEQTIKTNGKVHSIAMAPDGSNIVAAIGNNKKIVIYGVETGMLLNTFEDFKSISSIAFSSDGTYIAFGLFGAVRILNAKTGQDLKPLEINKGIVLAIAFSPDGQRILSATYNPFYNGSVGTWDIETGQRLQTVDVSQYGVLRKTAFSPDGNYVALGSYDEVVRIFDIKTRQCVRTLKGGNKALVESIAFSPDGKHIAFGSRDKNIRIFNAESGELLHTLKGHQDFVAAVAFSPDGQHIVSGSHDHTIRIWDISKIVNS